MLKRKPPAQLELFVAGSLEQLVPADHILARVGRVLDLGWLHDEVAGCYCVHGGCPGIDPEMAVRLMLAGFLLGIVHDRRLMREAQVNIAIRWFIGCGLHERLPDHSSLTRIRQRWVDARFRRIFERTVSACVEAGIAKGEVVHVDARPNASVPSRTAFRTVFRAPPRFRAIALIGTLFRKWSARIFTTVSNASIPFPPRTAQCSMRAKNPQRADRSNRNRKRPDGREPSAPSRRAGRRGQKGRRSPPLGGQKKHADREMLSMQHLMASRALAPAFDQRQPDRLNRRPGTAEQAQPKNLARTPARGRFLPPILRHRHDSNVRSAPFRALGAAGRAWPSHARSGHPAPHGKTPLRPPPRLTPESSEGRLIQRPRSSEVLPPPGHPGGRHRGGRGRSSARANSHRDGVGETSRYCSDMDPIHASPCTPAASINAPHRTGRTRESVRPNARG